MYVCMYTHTHTHTHTQTHTHTHYIKLSSELHLHHYLSCFFRYPWLRLPRTRAFPLSRSLKVANIQEDLEKERRVKAEAAKKAREKEEAERRAAEVAAAAEAERKAAAAASAAEKERLRAEAEAARRKREQEDAERRKRDKENDERQRRELEQEIMKARVAAADATLGLAASDLLPRCVAARQPACFLPPHLIVLPWSTLLSLCDLASSFPQPRRTRQKKTKTEGLGAIGSSGPFLS